ncbi:GNAT family N-acetyltransferase [Tunturibacter psychrotolerans]|uniref:GNAT family N-acetyltransferase n=1 Tax=Tunturiibacter psychrotolerans TaxID=3069686 RepID=A0AAU7ZM77_9BACT
MGFYTSRMDKFHLRVAGEDDVAAIRELIQASVRGLQAADYSSEQREGALATVFTVDSQLISDGTYFVAMEEGGVMAGCGGWSFRKTLYGGDHQVEKIESERLDPRSDAAKIRAIFVHPDFARMGLGSLILATAEEAAKAEGFTRFEMGSTLTGVTLYGQKGYREVERRKVPVGGRETIEVVRMVKDIGEICCEGDREETESFFFR